MKYSGLYSASPFSFQPFHSSPFLFALRNSTISHPIPTNHTKKPIATHTKHTMKLLILLSLHLANPPLIALSLLILVFRHIHSLSSVFSFNTPSKKEMRSVVLVTWRFGLWWRNMILDRFWWEEVGLGYDCCFCLCVVFGAVGMRYNEIEWMFGIEEM